MLKPMDIHNKEFRKAVRGYDTEEVDEFLDEIIVDFEKMQRELDLLRNQLSSYSDNMSVYKDRESALNNALVSAQQFADNMKTDAEIAAHAIIQEAEAKAEEIIGASEEKLVKMERNYNLLIDKYNEVKGNLRSYLQGQIQLLDQEQMTFETVEKIVIPKVVVKKAEDSITVMESEETKLNVKLKELMDAKDYNVKNGKIAGADYRY